MSKEKTFTKENKRVLWALGIGLILTITAYWIFETYIKTFSFPWWAYLILWLLLSGSQLQGLQRDAVEKKILNEKDSE